VVVWVGGWVGRAQTPSSDSKQNEKPGSSKPQARTRQDVDGRRLAGSVVTQQRRHRPPPDLERQPVQRPHRRPAAAGRREHLCQVPHNHGGCARIAGALWGGGCGGWVAAGVTTRRVARAAPVGGGQGKVERQPLAVGLGHHLLESGWGRLR